MAVVVVCDECWAMIGPIVRLADAGPEPHLCDGCNPDSYEDETMVDLGGGMVVPLSELTEE